MALLHRQRHKPKESVVSQVSTTTYQINTFHGILDFCAIRLDPSSLNGFSFSKIVQHNNGAIYFGRKRSELVWSGRHERQICNSLQLMSPAAEKSRMGCKKWLQSTRRKLLLRQDWKKCERQELNLHGFPHWILSRFKPWYRSRLGCGTSAFPEKGRVLILRFGCGRVFLKVA